jgi:hypothetical protein
MSAGARSDRSAECASNLEAAHESIAYGVHSSCLDACTDGDFLYEYLVHRIRRQCGVLQLRAVDEAAQALDWEFALAFNREVECTAAEATL